MILRDFRKQLEKVINKSGLSIDVVYFVLKDILNEVTQIYENTIREEEQQQAALEEQERIIKEQKEKELAELENAAAAERRIKRD